MPTSSIGAALDTVLLAAFAVRVRFSGALIRRGEVLLIGMHNTY